MANYQGNSIVDYLASTGQANDFASRTKLATSRGISGYTGSAQQNTQLLGLLRGNQAPTLGGYTQAPPSTTFNGSALSNPGKPVTIPTPGVTTGQANLQAKSDAVGLSTPTIYDPNKPLGADSTGLTATSSTADKVKARILTLAGIQSGQADETAKLQEENKLAEKQRALKDLENEYITTQRSFENQKRQLQTSPGSVSAAAANANLNKFIAESNQTLADIAIKKSVAQNDVSGALEIVKTAIEAKYEPIKNEIAGLKDYLALNNNDLTDSEKIQLQATIKEKEDAVNFQQQKELIDYKTKIDASVNGIHLTNNEKNTGSLNAGMTASDFSGLAPDVQNYYANSSKTQIDAINSVFDDYKNGTKSKDEVIKLIDESNNTQAVKDHLKSKLEKVTPQSKGWWDNVKSFFGTAKSYVGL